MSKQQNLNDQRQKLYDEINHLRAAMKWDWNALYQKTFSLLRDDHVDDDPNELQETERKHIERIKKRFQRLRKSQESGQDAKEGTRQWLEGILAAMKKHGDYEVYEGRIEMEYELDLENPDDQLFARLLGEVEKMKL